VAVTVYVFQVFTVAEALEATISHSFFVILSLRSISYAAGSLFTCEHNTLHLKPLTQNHTSQTPKQNQKNVFHREKQLFIENSIQIL
jgi:hypothetical protein